MDREAYHTALLAAELTRDPALNRRQARRLTPPVPGGLQRSAQRALVKLAPARMARGALAPAAAARRALLGRAAAGPPRFLLRVDEFPYSTSFDQPEKYGAQPAARFHAVLAEAEVPYLMAVVPQLVHDPLNPSGSGGRPLGPTELQLIARMADEGVTFAAHGLTHRTRDAHPRRHSELLGLTAAEVEELADQSLARLAVAGLHPRVFVPPFNRFTVVHYHALASRFDVICGGPESIQFLGAQPTPRWLGDAVYCPSYAPLYGTAREMLADVRQLVAEQPGTWIPLTLHLAWELDDGLKALKQLAAELGPYAISWNEFLAAADRARVRTAASPSLLRQ